MVRAMEKELERWIEVEMFKTHYILSGNCETIKCKVNNLKTEDTRPGGVRELNLQNWYS